MSPLPQRGELGGSGEGHSDRQDWKTRNPDTEASPEPGDGCATKHPKKTMKKNIRMVFDVGWLPWRKRKKKRDSIPPAKKNEDKGKVVRHGEQKGEEQVENHRALQHPRENHEPPGMSTSDFTVLPVWLSWDEAAEERLTRGNVHMADFTSSKDEVVCREKPSLLRNEVYKQASPKYSPSSDVSDEEDEAMECYRTGRWDMRFGKDTFLHRKKRRYQSRHINEAKRAKTTRRVKKENLPPEKSPTVKRQIKSDKNKPEQVAAPPKQESYSKLKQPSERKSEQQQERSMEKEAGDKICSCTFCILCVFCCLFLATVLFMGVIKASPDHEKQVSLLTLRPWDIFSVEVISTELLWIGALIVLYLVRRAQSFLTELFGLVILVLYNLSMVHVARLLFSGTGVTSYAMGPWWLVVLVVPLHALTFVVCLVTVAEI